MFIYRNRRSGSAAVDDSEESGIGIKTALFLIFFQRLTGAYIQRRGSILAWIVILSVYGADTVAEVMLLSSPILCLSLDLWNQIMGLQFLLIYME